LTSSRPAIATSYTRPDKKVFPLGQLCNLIVSSCGEICCNWGEFNGILIFQAGTGSPMSKIVLTFGTFDVFHVGHLRILERARNFGDKLVVGVSTDRLNVDKKGRPPVYTQQERSEIISALKYVEEVFLEESLDLKADYIKRYKAAVLVMGDDWQGKFDEFRDLCEVVYLPRSPAISTTEVIEKIRC
jgi:choline-phosphate cytidylyltransferase